MNRVTKYITDLEDKLKKLNERRELIPNTDQEAIYECDMKIYEFSYKITALWKNFGEYKRKVDKTLVKLEKFVPGINSIEGYDAKIDFLENFKTDDESLGTLVQNIIKLLRE